MFNKLKLWLCEKLCGCHSHGKDAEFIDILDTIVPKKGKSKGSGVAGVPKNRLNKGVVLTKPTGANTD